MKLTSSAFQQEGEIPKKYGSDFQDINPPLEWADAPEDTKSFALILEDPDVPPMAGVPAWDHWVVYNIPVTIRAIPEDWVVHGTRGKGSSGDLEYRGPRPPDREHRYFFHLYAVDTMLNLPEGATKDELKAAMTGHIIGEAGLMGRFSPH